MMRPGARPSRGVVRHRYLGALAAASAVCGATAAHAQSSAAPTPGDGSNVPITSLTVSLNGIYDSNVARTSAAGAVLRQVVPEDEIVQPEVSLQLQRPLGREAVFIDSSARYDF